MSRRIYAYTVIGKDTEPWDRVSGQSVVRGTGLIKVGQTTRTARERIRQQLGTAFPNLHGVEILLEEDAVRADGSEFSDHDLHTALVANGIQRPGGEWFEATLDEVKAVIAMVRTGIAFDPRRTETFTPRPEQEDAVTLTSVYFREHAADRKPLRFLWNAKMRFGKTFTAYKLAQAMGWTKVLVLTYKPAVQAAWKDDLLTHADFADWNFVDRELPTDQQDVIADSGKPFVWFASFQDLGGRTEQGQIKLHNESLYVIDWDCIILDEYHFGAWRDAARDLYDPSEIARAEDEEPDEQIDQDDLGLNAKHLLYLSGTPFRAITNGEFTEDQIFNWTYIDEQRAKETWDDPETANPYRSLPRMEMYTYEMGETAMGYATDGEHNGFSLNEFFATQSYLPGVRQSAPGAYMFERPGEVAEFLELLRGKLSDQLKMQVVAGQKAPFPYEAPEFHHAIRHSVWYLPNVAACFAMRDLLLNHSYFSGYEIEVIAGRLTPGGADALVPVESAIQRAERQGRSGSVTLTCGKLMTGVTVPQWGAIFMLRSLKSPETYFQSAFRVQSPWAHRDAEGKLTVHKPVCYVFEFDPNRALDLVAEYGVRLASTGDVTPSDAIGQLINYLPIYSFTGGRMVPLSATDVLDWAAAGIGSTALAARWNSPLLVNVNEHTIARVLDHPDLLAALEQIEDFRALIEHGQKVVTSTGSLKKAKREQGGELTPEQSAEQKATAKLRKDIREKLQKFLAKIPVFMYATDFRESALRDVIESLDRDLFERVTGLTVDDFRLLSNLGLFNAQNMDHAIYQFRAFEHASLLYAASEGEKADDRTVHPVGLWDTTIRSDEMPELAERAD